MINIINSMRSTQPEEGKLTTPVRYHLLALHNPMQCRNGPRKCGYSLPWLRKP